MWSWALKQQQQQLLSVYSDLKVIFLIFPVIQVFQSGIKN